MSLLNNEGHISFCVFFVCMILRLALSKAWRSRCLCAVSAVEYCSSDTLAINCRQPGLVILVARALYGRMSAGKCITSTYGESLGCRADVLSQLDEHCSGRTNCSMLVAVFDSLIQPCPRDFKSYLEVSYECVPGCCCTIFLSGGFRILE